MGNHNDGHRNRYVDAKSTELEALMGSKAAGDG